MLIYVGNAGNSFKFFSLKCVQTSSNLSACCGCTQTAFVDYPGMAEQLRFKMILRGYVSSKALHSSRYPVVLRYNQLTWNMDP